MSNNSASIPYWFHRNKSIYLFWVMWLVLCVLFNVEIYLGIYTSQFYLGGLIFVWLLKQLIIPNEIIKPLLVTTIIFILLIFQLIISEAKFEDVIENLGKMLILLFGVMTLRRLKQDVIKILILWMPMLTSCMVLVAYFTQSWDYYDTRLHRFGVPSFGSPNSTGYVLAFSLIMAHYNLSKSRMLFPIVMELFSVIICITALFGTQSRGGIFLYIIGALLFFPKKYKIYLLSVSAVVSVFYFGLVDNNRLSLENLPRFNIFSNLDSISSGSGRLVIWNKLFEDLIGNPISLIFGFGPGSIKFFNGEHLVNSAHSFFITIIYWYGIIGLIAILMLLIMLKKQISGSVSFDKSWIMMRNSFFWMFSIGAVFDSYALAGQLLWFTVILISIIFGHKYRRVYSSNPFSNLHMN